LDIESAGKNMQGEESRLKNTAAERTLLEALLSWLSILLRYRWLIIGVTAAGAAGIVAFCVVSIRLPPDKSPYPNQYTAQAVILVQKGTQNGLAASILGSLGIDPNASTTPVGYDNGALLVMILRSRTFLDRVIEEFNIADRYGLAVQAKTKARSLVLKKMGISYDRTTASIAISFVDTDPVFARDVTNRTVSLLNEWFIQNMGSSNLQQKQLLGEKVKEVKGEIDTLEKKLKALQNKYGVLTAQELGTSQATALAELRSQLILKEIDIKNYSTFTAIEDPKLQQLREERQNILDLINKFQAVSPNAQNGTEDQNSLPDVQMEFNNLAVELDVQRRIYNTLSHQFEVMKLTSVPEQAFQVLELAEVPDMKSGPQRTQLVVEFVLVAFIASILLASLTHGISQARRKARQDAAGKGGRQ
jgi:tyrosine-protein kinase Etk/Wzc